MKKFGFGTLHLLIIACITFALFVLQRQNISILSQQIGDILGLNFNNIATDEYVGFIKSQNGSEENVRAGIFLNKNIPVAADSKTSENVLGTTPPDDNKWIEVDLSDQKLYLKEGNSTTHSFLVSTGKWWPTPQGEWRIWTKLRYTRMRGGSKALGTFYDLPNVPYTMYYYQGYGIHGAYWHNNFGTPMSHGCINMKPEEAGIVFNWASVGTRVVVHS